MGMRWFRQTRPPPSLILSQRRKGNPSYPNTEQPPSLINPSGILCCNSKLSPTTESFSAAGVVLYAMAIENCISDLDQIRRRSGKRQRISSELANLPPPISKLTADLLQEILIRLPNPRVACLCKLVCKPWCSLISSPGFNRLFVSHHQTMSLNHAPIPDNPYELLSMIRSFLPPMPSRVQSRLRVLDCNKDLVLCGFLDLARLSEESSRAYLVCNPFSKQWIALPLAPRKYAYYDSPAARCSCLGFLVGLLQFQGTSSCKAWAEEVAFVMRAAMMQNVHPSTSSIIGDCFCL
ncbi:unnamed protein product [Linum trigynum]|uniref:F-box domain-containing protein n=1 Tax=Linum trigynum TaxID=586398 RepID=A0AAV2G150_9ROSI